jgi:acyl-CoA thioesterase YciA
MDYPKGALVIQTVAMPKDTNPSGDIFGGWLLSQMDLGAGIMAHKMSSHRMVTVAVNSMSFIRPVYVGDTIGCYGTVIKKGHTSVTIKIEVWVQRYEEDLIQKVTEGDFTMVAIDRSGKPTEIKWKS